LEINTIVKACISTIFVAFLSAHEQSIRSLARTHDRAVCEAATGWKTGRAANSVDDQLGGLRICRRPLAL